MSARSLNKVQLIGNLTREPELRYTTGGTPVVTFGLATNRSWKDQNGETKEVAEFHNIVAWNKMAEICQQLLAKGMKIYVEGSLTTRSWEADDGSTRYKTEIRVDDMILLDSKGKQGAGFESGSEKAPVQEVEEVEEVIPEEETSDEDPLEDSDLPF
ncbi:MAG: Single-stranded DNA-binding protein [candidate division WS6 bacterium GW2011_GWE1_34_7]|uniref:Single-stranded DNA-binding protein n=1 Tax=candidate division WS6 bacterium GW2011_GWE1_34_7 TaxID=1619093 RepID=A0A0G0B811_9BACT|nr:MAG: Single-stranded DNA-binding protein [candidate division WS6 bacterium GW2011_GWE1_34_7]